MPVQGNLEEKVGLARSAEVAQLPNESIHPKLRAHRAVCAARTLGTIGIFKVPAIPARRSFISVARLNAGFEVFS